MNILNFCQSNNTTGNPGASITGGLAQFMSAFAQIIRISMDNQSATNDVVVPIQRNNLVDNVDFGNAIISSFDVTQIAYMTAFVARTSMILVVGVEMCPGGNAAVGVVTEFVNMEAMKTFAQTGHFAGYFNRAR